MLLVLVVSGVCIVLSNLTDNIIFFYPPSDLSTISTSGDNKIRVGGMVEDSSVRYTDSGIEFYLTDYKKNVKVLFSGMLPALFREGQGIVAEGVFDAKKNIFLASQLLAKHDENYMPPEIRKSIKSLQQN
jgi:cytochrome c-type biogenesis protein CcmE